MTLPRIASVALPTLPLLLLTADIVAQIERPIPYPIPKDRNWNRAVQNETRTDTGSPGSNYWTNYAQYKINAELFPETAKVKGHVDIVYHNRSPRSLREVRIHLRQNLYKAGSLRNRYVEITGGVTVDNVMVDGESLSRRASRIRGTVMRVRLPERLRSDERVTVSMDWEFQVPMAGIEAWRRGYAVVRNGHDGHHVFYLAYWYPQVAVDEDVAGWVAEQYMSNAEFYMGYGDYDLEFTVPAGWLMRATGSLENADKVLTKTAVNRLKKARETSEDPEVVNIITGEDLKNGKVTRKGKKKLTWRFVAKNVRDIAVSASDQYIWDATYAVIQDKHGPGKDGKCMIHAVYRPRRGGRSDTRGAEWARHTIEYMSHEVYPYPWPHMTACEGIIGGGMEFPMMTIIGRFSHGVTAHELIHMWFPMIVGSNEKARAWQDEGFTSYYTSNAQADFRGRDIPRAVNAGGYMRAMARGGDAPMMRHGDLYGEGRGSYSFASYAKTSIVMRQLQGMLGEEVFKKAMRKYAKEWAYKHPYPKDFFNTFSTVSGQDLDWYFRTWFYETWALDQAVASVVAKGQTTEVMIADRGNATYPTEVRVTYTDDKTETRKVDVQHFLSGKRTVTLKFGAGVKKVEIDPRRVTLDLSRNNNTWEADN